MSRDRRTGKALEITDNGAFAFLVGEPVGSRIGKYNEITPPRMIYYDQQRAAELLEDVASTALGRELLADLATSAGVAREMFLEQSNHRAILSQLIVGRPDLDMATIMDLCQPDISRGQVAWQELHPDQGIVIQGAVDTAKDVQPSRLQIKIGTEYVRAYVERDHFLHLNQKYLAGRPIIVAGKVRSVPRSEMRVAAIGTITEAISPPPSAEA